MHFKIFELLRIYETVLTKYFQFNIYESLKLNLQQNMGKGKCHPTFCCRIIAQNRTWYTRDKRRCGSTWQVIWTNVSSIPRTPGLQAPEHWPDDANLQFLILIVLFFSWYHVVLLRQNINNQPPCCFVVSEKDYENLDDFLKNIKKEDTFGMIYGRQREVDIFVFEKKQI